MHIHNTNISRNIVNNNDDFNERKNTLLHKNISHTLFSKVLRLVVCERWVGDGDRLLHFDPSSSDHSSTSFSSWLGLLNRKSQGPKPSVCRWLSIRHLVPNWLKLTQAVRAPGYIIVWHPPASAVFLLIYTGASLDWRLGRGSICYISYY